VNLPGETILFRWISRGLLTIILVAAGSSAYFWTRSRVTVGIYRDRLRELSTEHAELRDRYNAAVRKTAVTELVVAEGRITVALRTVEGVIETIETPFSPDSEIYVDYVVADGRLWVRRIFDAETPPNRALVLDPKWGEVDWELAEVRYGKAVYRDLSDGRWVVTVTGDGSLGLARRDGEAPLQLSPPPRVQDYPELQEEIDARVHRITLGEVVRQVLPGRNDARSGN